MSWPTVSNYKFMQNWLSQGTYVASWQWLNWQDILFLFQHVLVCFCCHFDSLSLCWQWIKLKVIWSDLLTLWYSFFCSFIDNLQLLLCFRSKWWFSYPRSTIFTEERCMNIVLWGLQLNHCTWIDRRNSYNCFIIIQQCI